MALVIVNQSYNSAIGVLAKAREGAGLVSAALKRSRFEVLETAPDLSRSDMQAVIEKFAQNVHEAARKARASGEKLTTFFYYAGHGLADATGDNYLVPVDAISAQRRWLGDAAIPLSYVISKIHSAAQDGNHFIVFDACRTRTGIEPSIPDAASGFQRLDLEHLPSGTYLTLSAEFGRTAPDSIVFAETLARYIVRANTTAEVAFTRLREDVFAATSKRQIPVTLGSLNGKILLGFDVPTSDTADAYEALDAKGLLFINPNVAAFRIADPSGGIVEVLGRGSVHYAAGRSDIVRVVKPNGAAWITYTTPWGRAYVPSGQVQLF